MTEPQVLSDAGVSDREAEVLALIGEHLTNAEIAARLYISVRTVESHVSALLRKLDRADRRALADLAVQLYGVAGGPPSEGPAVAGGAGRDLLLPAPLPSPLTSFVGRAAERAALAEALTGHRLVTVVGPGGVGKTRLALAVAADVTERHRDGAWYVDLVPVSDPAMVGAAVAAALGSGEQLGRSPTDTVVARLGDADALVVLDNCEHLVDGVVEFVERLLSGCPDVSVLATSQARLLLPFESVFPVRGLSLSGDAAEGEGGGDAVALFLDRAAMAGWTPLSTDDLGRIAAICDGLDGIALAIELAAARVAALGLDGLESGLARPLGLLAGAARLDERHRSVRSTVDWSYALLDAEAQAVLRRTAVFARAFAPDAAASVAGFPPLDAGGVAAALARLADHSLLVVLSGPAGTRYRMLHTIRQYGEEQLEQGGEQLDVHRRHLVWCLARAEALDAELPVVGATGPTATPADPIPTDPAFDAVADDLRAALGWATGQPDHQVDAHRLGVRLGELTFARGMVSEAQRRYVAAAALAPGEAEASRDLEQGAAVAMCRLAGDDALQLYLAAGDTARRAGEDQRAALDLARAAEIMDRSPGLLSDPPGPERLAEVVAEARSLAGDDPHALAAISVIAFGVDAADLDPAQAEHAIAVARAVGDLRLESAALDQLTVVQLERGQLLEAAATSSRRLDLLVGPDSIRAAFEMSDALHMAALTSIGAGDVPNARRYAQRRRELPFHREDDYLVVNWLLVLGALTGHWDQVIALSEHFRLGWERAGRLPLRGFASVPAAAGMVCGLQGDDAGRSAWLEIFGHMRQVGADLPGSRTGYAPTFEAILLLHRGQAADAAAALDEDPGALTVWSAVVWRQWYAALWAEAAVLAGRADRDERLGRARSITAGNPVASAIVDRAEALAAEDRPGLQAAAVALAAAECPYQQARTLVLAGGPERTEGERLLAAMGATPMPV